MSAIDIVLFRAMLEYIYTNKKNLLCYASSYTPYKLISK